MLAVDPRKLDEIPESIVKMMGYNTHRPSIGHGKFFKTKSIVLSYDKQMEVLVGGMNPRKEVSGLMQWTQNPVDQDPPTFATKWESKL